MRYSILLGLLSCSVWAADRWEMQYFHDVDQEQLRLDAIAFCSPTRGIASGALLRSRSDKPAAVVTSNGGKTWTLTEAEERAHAIFFLDETSGWMVTESGIWFTDECGRNWRRIHKQRGLTDVRFISRDRGWAIGAEMTFLETSDGGKTWSRVKAVEKLSENPDRVVFDTIDFMNPKMGLVLGRLRKARDPRLPLWLDPHPETRREQPQLAYTVETRNGGATWVTNKVSIFGRISRTKLRPDGSGLILIEFDEYFEFPSELYHQDVLAGGKGRVLRQKDLALTDILAGPVAFAAGFKPPGRMFRSPVPGKVRILRSKDLFTWTEDEVDYRAVATRVRLAESDGQVWAATDTGMILKLTRQ
jgi:Photosynthesis system II assembly factor YCF48